MTNASPAPINEPLRLAAVAASELFDAVPEARLDRITRMLAAAYGVPIAFFSVIGEWQLCFKSRFGIDMESAPREGSFCHHALASGGAFCVPDATLDERFRDHPAVAGEAGLRYYASYPVKLPGSGQTIGKLCVTDTAARDTASAVELALLEDYAGILEDAIEQRCEAIGRERNMRASQQAASRMAEVAERTKNRFTAMIGHELRTPLTAIMGFSELLAMELHGKLRPAYRDYARTICAGGNRLLRTVEQLISYADMDRGQIGLAEERFDLDALIRQTVSEQQGAARLTGVKIDYAGNDGPPALFADPIMTDQMLGQLIGNAVKFSPAEGTVTVAVGRDALGALKIIVEDEGIGMPDDDLNSALSPYRQLDEDLDRRFEGMGLGLPLTNMLIGRHGGLLTVERRRPRGTRAILSFPIWRCRAKDEPVAQVA